MKVVMIIFLTILALSSFSATTHAQNKQSAADTVHDLKFQLIDIDAQLEMTKLHVEQLDEALKPENIERSLAGIGSTRPEELREQRRRQLSIEKKAVDAQLERLSFKKSQLESALATAEAQAYQESAGGGLAFENQLRVISFSPKLLIAFGLLGILIVAVVVCIWLLLRSQSLERALR